MSHPIKALLSGRAVELAARVVLTFPFWGSGLDKLFNFTGAVAEMRMFGLEPAPTVALAVILVQLGGSALVILNRPAWLGAGTLGVFTLLTIPIVHHFWALEGAASVHAFHTATEHVGMIGGLVAIAALSVRPRLRPTSEPADLAMPQVVPIR